MCFYHSVIPKLAGDLTGHDDMSVLLESVDGVYRQAATLCVCLMMMELDAVFKEQRLTRIKSRSRSRSTLDGTRRHDQNLGVSTRKVHLQHLQWLVYR